MSELDHDELVHLYGPWSATTPTDAASLLGDYPGRWWVAGGWAIEAFTGRHREHGDLDLSIPRQDVPVLRRYLAGRLDVWAAADGTLRPLLPQDVGTDRLPDGCGNVWLRPDGSRPWRYDVQLMDHRDDVWIFKRHAGISLPLQDIVWRHDGIAYLRPEIQLLHKAARVRRQDQADFDATWPLLDTDQRAWLHDALAATDPRHAWLSAG